MPFFNLNKQVTIQNKQTRKEKTDDQTTQQQQQRHFIIPNKNDEKLGIQRLTCMAIQLKKKYFLEKLGGLNNT